MRQDTRTPLIQVKYNTINHKYEINFTQLPISPIHNPDLETAMEMAKDAIKEYKTKQVQDHKLRSIKHKIERIEGDLQQLKKTEAEIELEYHEERPEYSFLNATQFKLYKWSIKSLPIEKVNWWEENNDVTIISADFCISPELNPYGTELIHRWMYKENVKESS